MPLAGYQPKRIRIEFDGTEVSVRAVSLPDVAALVESHREAVDRIATAVRSRVEFLKEQETPFEPEMAMDTLIEVISESPYVAATLISLCVDEPGAYREALNLPLAIQISILRAVSDLTFSDAEVLGKFVADVQRLVGGILPLTPAAAA